MSCSGQIGGKFFNADSHDTPFLGENSVPKAVTPQNCHRNRIRQLKILNLRIALLSSVFVFPSISIGDEISLGSKRSPVNIIEYGSLTCDYCIDFHRNVLPKIVEAYIAVEKVSFTYRHYPTSKPALEGAVAADCSGEKFYEMLDFLYNEITEWYMVSDRQHVFEAQASSMGINLESFRKCIASEQAKEKVIAEQRTASDEYGVLGTPTFIVNGDKVTGKQTFEEMKLLIEVAIKKSQQNI